MQLREEGKVRLDDPVAKYLTWFKAKPAGDDDGPITIEQLLSHSSGLQREAGDHWTSFEFPTADELRRLYATRQAAFAPSVRWKYSNLAYAVAGMIIEQVSGERWADYVDRNIFKPLGMLASSVDKNLPGLAVPYGRRMPDGSREVLPFVDARGLAAATGVTSNLEDMAKFVSAQFRRGPRGGAQIVSTGSLREMHRVRSVEDNWTSGTGLGFDITRFKDRTYVGHGGGYPGNTTHTLIQLDDKVGVIVLTNTNDSNPSDIARQLMATVGQAVAKVSASKRRRSRGTRRGRGSRDSTAGAEEIRTWCCSIRSSRSSRRTRRTSTARSRSNRSAEGASDSSRRRAAAPLAKWCVSWSRLAARCGCTSATAGSIACSSGQ